MFNALLNLLGIALDTADQSYQRVKKALIVGILGIFALSFLRAIIPWGQFTPILIGLTVLLASVVLYRVFRIADLVGIMVLGEFFELLGITTERLGPDNVTIRKALRLLLLVILSILVMGITLAFLPMGAHWWLFLVWPSILLAITFISIATDVIVLIAWLKLGLLFVLLLCATFPQIRAQLGIDKLGYLIVPTEVSEMVNQSRENIEQLRVRELKADAEVVRKATATTPYRNLPPEYKAFLDAGGRKTLREFRASSSSKRGGSNILPPSAKITSTTTGPPLGCPDCVEVPYVFSGGRNFHLNWQYVPGLKPGDTVYLWGIEIEGLGGGPRSNSITPEKVRRGVDIVLAEGYNMPYPLWAKIKRR
jgi:hypothetical protein